LEDEIATGRYDTEPGLLERLLGWLDGLLSGVSGTGGVAGWVLPLVVLLVLAVAVAVVLVVVRRDPGAGGGSARPVLDETGLDAAAYRARASAARERGDWDATLLDAFRALAASAAERSLVDALPGRTAHEVATALGPVFPDRSARLSRAADAFDAVRYGDRRAGREDADALLALEAELRTTRPVLTGSEARR
jgi:hypothetical protein